MNIYKIGQNKKEFDKLTKVQVKNALTLCNVIIRKKTLNATNCDENNKKNYVNYRC